MSVDLTFQPKIITYWIGWTPQSEQAYPQFQVPSNIDVVTLAFALVQDGLVFPGLLEMPLPPNSNPCSNCVDQNGTTICPTTCLLDTNVDPSYTRDNLKSWIQAAKQANPNLKFLLSIGGSRYCDWNSITDPSAFANSVKDELARWNDECQLIDGVDIDYENADCCGTTFDPSSSSIVEVIEGIAGILDNGILSLPIYGGTPQDLQQNFAKLKSSVSYVATMDYGCSLYWWSPGYQGVFNWLAMGFSTPGGDNPHANQVVTECFAAASNDGVTLSAAMLWNLGDRFQTPLFLKAIENALT
ncbi:MAG TPA: glycosyl hydrolase family 18 protein [Pyrinomonadaceae bacterium]|nr:glycosyl hydrolase family 18 protein [Pyrinomonadaceae bacterium]